MKENMREFFEKVKMNSVLKDKKLSVIGGCIMAIGIIGIIPSTVFSMPFIVETLEEAEILGERNLTHTIKLDGIENAKVLELDTSDLFRLSNVYLDKSETGYSYIDIFSARNVIPEIKIDIDEDGTMYGRFESNLKDYEIKMLKPEMTPDEVIDTLAMNFMSNADELYDVKIYLHKPIEVDLSKETSMITIEDSTNISTLKSGTEHVEFKDNGSIENLTVYNDNDHTLIDEDFLSKAKNINLYSGQVDISLREKPSSIPETLNIKAENLDINNSYKLGESVNVNVGDNITLRNSSGTTINSKSIERIIGYSDSNLKFVDWKGIPIEKITDEYENREEYYLKEGENSFSIRERSDGLKLNIISHLNELIIE